MLLVEYGMVKIQNIMLVVNQQQVNFMHKNIMSQILKALINVILKIMNTLINGLLAIQDYIL